MKYFKKQTLRFEKAWNLKNLRKERTFSVMFFLPFFEQKEGSMKKKTRHRAVFRPFFISEWYQNSDNI